MLSVPKTLRFCNAKEGFHSGGVYFFYFHVLSALRLCAFQHGPVVEDVQWIIADEAHSDAPLSSGEAHSDAPLSSGEAHSDAPLSSGAAKSYQISNEDRVQILKNMLLEVTEEKINLEIENMELRKKLKRRSCR